MLATAGQLGLAKDELKSAISQELDGDTRR
jgi:hypothetical protein